MNCSVCNKLLKASDKIVLASCGHLVHCFKVECEENDCCLICHEAFTILASNPFVKLDSKVDLKLENKVILAPAPSLDAHEQKDEANNNKEEKTELVANEVVAVKRLLDDDFILKQFETQRDITNLLMNKLQLTDQFVVMAKEQQAELKKVYSTVIQLYKDSTEIKIQMKQMQECIEQLNEFFEDEFMKSLKLMTEKKQLLP